MTTSTSTSTSNTDPTGLDYQAAFATLYPGLVADGIRLADVQDNVLRVVDRGARIRKAERERVKNEFSGLATQLEADAVTASYGMEESALNDSAARIRKLIEEIR